METSSCRPAISLPACDAGIFISCATPFRLTVSHFHLHRQRHQRRVVGLPLYAVGQSNFSLVATPPNKNIRYLAGHPSDVVPLYTRDFLVPLII